MVFSTGLNALPTGLGALPTGLGALPAGLSALPTGLGALPTGLGALPTGLSRCLLAMVSRKIYTSQGQHTLNLPNSRPVVGKVLTIITL